MTFLCSVLPVTGEFYGFFISFSDVLDIFFEIFTSGCDASENDGSCCTSSNPCGIGQGDCDSNSDCAGNLVCGSNNCKNFDSAWSSSYYDCCMEGKTNHTTAKNTKSRCGSKNNLFFIFQKISQLFLMVRYFYFSGCS